MRVAPYTLYERLLPFLDQKNDSNRAIAQHVLRHMQEIPSCSVFELAERSNVSASSVSRFVQKIGFEDYISFRDYVAEEIARNSRYGLSHPEENIPFAPPYTGDSIEKFLHTIPKALAESFSPEACQQIETLCRRMKEKENVYFLGYRSMDVIIDHIKNELLPHGLFITRIRNLEEIQTPKNTNLIVLFSMHGYYFSRDISEQKVRLARCADTVFVVSQTSQSGGFPMIRLKKCATSWADSIVWILLAEQIVYAYKYLIK